ncbi:hypothetical protein Lal_00020360 [Lupinus albus]|uniref:Uncharacterized protein n=1 Tax=Lupinus albus TaxID=3870 RepID=A0A6A4Q661_LUPAL|nr:hypothetical protein Lalb_Chr08g0240931 [Lupinus albus]KAF1871566.1 hypothetical protein Lal_00020360 [Lupinus albus]
MLDHKTHQPTNSVHLSDGTRHRTNTYHDDTWEATNSTLWPSKQPELRTQSKVVVVDDESGICSPPLWKTSPPMSPKDERDNDYRSLSPKSRTQAIVKGQRELMDMVKNMPETHYELSLKDIVEHHQQRVDPREEKRVVEKKKSGGRGSGRRVVVLDKVASVKRNNGVKVDHGGGFYLKMVFPFTLGSKDKKKKVMKKKESNSVNGSSKVSPKPSGSEKEWWKKSLSGIKDSDSAVSSINSRSMKSSSGRSSSTNSSNSSRHEKSGGGCWYFIQRPKSQKKK